MRRHLLLLAVLLAAGCDDGAPSPAAPTPEPERIPVFIVGVEPTPVPLSDPAQITLGMSKPVPDVTAVALFRAVSPDGGYNSTYEAKFSPGSTTSTTPIFTIDSHNRAGGYAGLIGEWTLTLEEASFPLQIGDPREIKYTVAYPAAAASIGATPNPVKVGEPLWLNCWLRITTGGGRLYRDVDIPIETTTPAGNSTVSTITIPDEAYEVRVRGSTTIVGDWTYRILGARLPEGVILGRLPSVTVTVEP